jgi:hypothetical protein
MAEAGRIDFCLDESMGRPLAPLLRTIRAPGNPHIHDLRELGLTGSADEVWMPLLAGRGARGVVTKDSSILRASVRRDVWRRARLTVFVLNKGWGNLPLFEQARALVWWWPAIVERGSSGPTGAAWELSTDLRMSGIRRMFSDP